jgi:hypothetical protein
MKSSFRLLDWNAFAPGLESKPAWLAWAQAPALPVGDAMPALAEMPAMQRRRVEKLGRMALQVAYWSQPSVEADCPLVFATRHGDLPRTYSMLQELAREQPLSPTHFGLSTHNAIAAQYGIARALPANYLAVSAGACTGEAAVVEALGLLADGAREVLVINYDGPVPGDYSQFCDEPDGDYAWAWRIGADREGAEMDAPRFSLEALAADQAAEPAGNLPHGLDLMRFVLSGDSELRHGAMAQRWRWRRHA